MRVAVIGGNGQLGNYVAKDLVENDYEVCVMDVQNEVVGDFPYEKCDITDLALVEQRLEGFDAVALTGAIPTARPFELWPDIVRINVEGTFNVFYAAAKLEIPKVAFASSICAQGAYLGKLKQPIHYLPVDEEHPGFGSEPYGASKTMNELHARGFASSHDMSLIGLRFANICNVEKNGTKPLSTHIHWTKVDVKDAATSYRLCFESEGIDFDYFIIGSRCRYNEDGSLESPDEMRAKVKECGAVEIKDESFFADSRATHTSDKAIRILGYDPKY